MACNPYGVTVLTNSLPRYAWLRHSSHMSDCLVNNNVNDILEDSAGNLWFATGDGISVLSDHGRRWRTLLSRHATPGDAEPRPVLALCEVEPGVVWATGYSDEISVVRGGGASVSTLRTFTEAGEERADKFIQSAYRDADGYVWLGGFYTLRRIDPLTGGCRYYAIDQVSCITARDDRRLWIGTARGLYSLDRKSGSLTQLRLSKRRHTYICSLRQTADGKLYIGTSCSGLMVYDPATGRCRNYNSANSTLITDNIHTIVANGDGSKLVMGTDKGLTQYDVRRDIFRNWTYDQGMLTTYFNATSGVYSSDSSFVMGSNDGVVAFRINSWHDRPMRSRMVLSDMRIDHELVRPGDENSPLTDDIDNTTSITLSHDQNTFSIDLSSINYDYPSDVVYTWRLLGLDSRWTRLDDGGVIRYSALHPGRYTLQVRAVSSESRDHVIEQREIAIRVFPPVWLSLPALLIYAVVLVVAVWLLVRLAAIIRQRRASAEKIDFFVRSAHDIRTPLTLIKAPLEELSRTERFTADGSANMEVAMRNVESLLRLTDNLMNFERASAASATLSRSDHSLGLYVSEQAKPFADYAALRGVSLSFVDHTDGAVVSFDREKMDSVLKNLLSNAVKYTPKGGAVTVTATDGSDAWSVEVADTGIGIPASERRKLFRLYYRASNAVNMSVAGSGVGLMLVRRLVEMHGGKVTLRSVDGGGTSVRISVPKDSKTVVAKVEKSCNAGRRLLIAEDNEELRNYLKHSLETSYDVRLCSNGKQALTEISEYKPDIIISDIMMPEMRGDELCAAVKGNIETSHIPVILLTALSSENDVLHGLSLNADDYIAKPFSVGMLRARIDNLLSNRRLLWRKYVAGSGVEMSQSDVDRLTELDRRFVDDVRRCVLEHVDDRNFNVDTLCGLLNMSRTSFYNKIKALTDSSPADFIRAVRLARAAELLSSGGGYSVTEVAEMSGFNDAKYFREVFRRHYGVSPTKYGGQKKNF
jgi:signal transduction histidine kinase/DNA-binding response OmpR family regulator